MKCFILLVLTFILSFVSLKSHAQDGYEEVTIRELNEYETAPQTADDFPHHPMVGKSVQFDAIVVSNPRSSGLANFTEEEDDEEIGIERIHFFVVDENAFEEGREGMYMQVVASDVGEFETLQRGDLVTLQGTHAFFNSTVQFQPDNLEFRGNIIQDDDYEDYRELLEPMEVSLSDINTKAGDGTFTFKPESYEKYINAYVKFENKEVLGSDLDDQGRPNFYVIDDEGIPIWKRDLSLRFRNDRNDVQGGYRKGYNYRRVEEEAGFEPDGEFQPPASGSIVNLSGFVVWDDFDPYNLNESDEFSTLQVAPMEDGVLWWGIDDQLERRTTDPNDLNKDWPNDLVTVGYPPEISNYEINTTQPGAEGEDDQVEIVTDIVGPSGVEEVYDVKVTWETSLGEEGEDYMDSEGGDTYSFVFEPFEDFTNVEFAIEATADIEIQGEIISTTGRFTDGIVDGAGNTLNMSFTQIGEEVNDIATIQTTIDGHRDKSPLEAMGVNDLKVDFSIDAVVVSTSEAGFVVVHDEAAPWSGIPLAASDEVAGLKRGQIITITDAIISNENNNVYLDEVEFSAGNVIDDPENTLDDYIPTVTPAEATANDGAAYEGMIIQLENVYAADNQADAPNDFGEWTIAAQGDNDGTLRINDFPTFDPVTEEFGTTVPSDLNAQIRVGAEFDAVYGFSAYSFGNPKIHLRDLDDLITEESFTWPKRDIELFYPTAADVPLVINGEQEYYHAEIQKSVSYDGEEVSYKWVLAQDEDKLAEEPLIEITDYEQVSDTVRFEISEHELQDAYEKAGQSNSNEEVEFVWTVYMTNDDEEYVQYSEKDGAYFIPSFNYLTVEAIPEMDLSVTYNEGWNMLGLPVELEDTHYQNLFSDAIEGTLFGFNGSYTDASELETGSGYWLRFSDEGLTELSGTPFASTEVELSEGWNLISGVSGIVGSDQIEDPDQIIIEGTLFGFDGTYYDADEIMPGSGYWIRASESGSIDLHTDEVESDKAPKLSIESEGKIVEETNNFNRLIFITEDEQEYALKFGAELSDEMDFRSFSLPPAPPSEAFDVRFDSDKYLIEGREEKIKLQMGQQETLHVRFKPSDNKQSASYKINLEDNSIPLIPEEKTELLDGASDDKVVMELLPDKDDHRDIPEEFALKQNYPNPFNPSTKIRYDLAESVDVRLEVYNILGQRIEVLVDEEQQAGRYDVTFDASRLSSGAYIYRIEAGDFSKTRQMMFVK